MVCWKRHGLGMVCWKSLKNDVFEKLLVKMVCWKSEG